MKNIAIIGASYLQLPLIRKAKELGYKTHVFAWKTGDIGEKEADMFYPVSIVEKEKILEICKTIGIDGICSIASDLAIITVNYVAQNMGLISNSLDCTSKSTNKHLMRKCFELNNDPSPKSLEVDSSDNISLEGFKYPLIVKPTDRSGSRGICKILNESELKSAINKAIEESFEKKALIEEFAEGQEYSIECISFKGVHNFLSMTKKYTTGSPHFIETGHLEPAPVKNEVLDKVIKTTFHALDSLGIEYGASHTEIKIDDNGVIKIIEIGGRMGGDFIGSDLVHISTGFDFVKAVIDVAVGTKPKSFTTHNHNNACVKFVFSTEDLEKFRTAVADTRVKVMDSSIDYETMGNEITDSSNRHGFFILSSDDGDLLESYLI